MRGALRQCATQATADGVPSRPVERYRMHLQTADTSCVQRNKRGADTSARARATLPDLPSDSGRSIHCQPEGLHGSFNRQAPMLTITIGASTKENTSGTIELCAIT